MQTTDIPLMPIAGINTEAEDAALSVGGDAPRIFVREALNLDITPAGKIDMRAQVRRVSPLPLANLWQSPLHGDVFATLGTQWGRVNTNDWRFEALAEIGDGPVSHAVLNNLVAVAGPAGILSFDGTRARRLTIPTPAPPLVTVADDGALAPGAYGFAVSYLRGPQESAVSAMTSATAPERGGCFELWLAPAPDASVTGIRLYMTRPDGGELARVGDFPPEGASMRVPTVPTLGMPPQFQHKDPMPTGEYLRYWRGRLLTVSRNVLRWSEAMAYHLHDPRYGFAQMPQRITFCAPVDGGIWLGQVDHVVFLAGASPESFELQRRAARPPVPGSAILLDAETAGEAAQGGTNTALWLADNGYVLGTASGMLVEPHAGVLGGIAGEAGQSVVLEGRVLTVVR